MQHSVLQLISHAATLCYAGAPPNSETSVGLLQHTSDLTEIWGVISAKMMSDNSLSPSHPEEASLSGDEAAANQIQKSTNDDPYDGLTEGTTRYAGGEVAVLVHFREIPKDSITREHVISLLGPEKSKESSAIEERQLKIEKLKTDLRGWAREHVKKRVVGTARKLGFKIVVNKREVDISTFADLKLWWRTRQRSDKKAVDDLTYVLYGWFDNNTKWERKLERQFMEEHKWAYTSESVEEANENSKKEGADLKGCVALTMTYLKVEAVRQMQRVGKAAPHGIVITKTRPKSKQYNDKGKYVKRKKGEYFFQVYPKSATKKKVMYLLLLILRCCTICIFRTGDDLTLF